MLSSNNKAVLTPTQAAFYKASGTTPPKSAAQLFHEAAGTKPQMSTAEAVYRAIAEEKKKSQAALIKAETKPVQSEQDALRQQENDAIQRAINLSQREAAELEQKQAVVEPTVQTPTKEVEQPKLITPLVIVEDVSDDEEDEVVQSSSSASNTASSDTQAEPKQTPMDRIRNLFTPKKTATTETDIKDDVKAEIKTDVSADSQDIKALGTSYGKMAAVGGGVAALGLLGGLAYLATKRGAESKTDTSLGQDSKNTSYSSSSVQTFANDAAKVINGVTVEDVKSDDEDENESSFRLK